MPTGAGHASAAAAVAAMSAPATATCSPPAPGRGPSAPDRRAGRQGSELEADVRRGQIDG